MSTTLSWSGVSVHLNGQEPRWLLKNAAGIARPGEMLVILGPSGAGKTTLLNILSGRLNASSSSSQAENSMTSVGTIYLNGISVKDRPDIVRRSVAFVEQDDVFPGYLTVFEHLWFHAQLRLLKSSTMSDIERKQRVESLLTEFNLTVVRDTLIGYLQLGMKTLSGGERKRLSIATQLVSNASLLFLDEPTTGLDSFMSKSVMVSLRQQAQSGKTVVFTIHQPSSELFSFFDRLYLLSEGFVCFTGTPKDAATFFDSKPLSKPCPSSYNPADFYLDLLSRPYFNNDLPTSVKFISEVFTASDFGQQLNDELRRPVASSSEAADQSGDAALIIQEPKASVLMQLKWCTWRAAKLFYRSPRWTRLRVFNTVAMSLFFGIVYFQVSLTPTDVMNRCGLIYEIIVLNSFDSLDAYSATIPLERDFLMRESQAGLYSLGAYFFGRQFIELPLLLLLSTVGTTIVSLMTNLWGTMDADGVIILQLSMFLSSLVASSFGYVIGFVSDNLAVVIMIRRVFLVVLATCSGFYVNIKSVPSYFLWVVYLSMFYYSYEAASIAEWINVGPLDCGSGLGINSTADSWGCFPSGRAVLDFYSFGDLSTAYRNLAILAAMTIIWRGVALLVLYLRSYWSIWLTKLKRKLQRRP